MSGSSARWAVGSRYVFNDMEKLCGKRPVATLALRERQLPSARISVFPSRLARNRHIAGTCPPLAERSLHADGASIPRLPASHRPFTLARITRRSETMRSGWCANA